MHVKVKTDKSCSHVAELLLAEKVCGRRLYPKKYRLTFTDILV